MPIIRTPTGTKEFPYTKEGITAARDAMKTTGAATGVANAMQKGKGKKLGLRRSRIMTSDGFMPRKGTNQMTKPAVMPSSSSKSGQELVAGVENLRNYGKGMVAGAISGASAPNMESMKGMGGKIIDSVGTKLGGMTAGLDKKFGTNTAGMLNEQIAKAKKKVV